MREEAAKRGLAPPLRTDDEACGVVSLVKGANPAVLAGMVIAIAGIVAVLVVGFVQALQAADWRAAVLWKRLSGEEAAELQVEMQSLRDQLSAEVDRRIAADGRTAEAERSAAQSRTRAAEARCKTEEAERRAGEAERDAVESRTQAAEALRRTVEAERSAAESRAQLAEAERKAAASDDHVREENRQEIETLRQQLEAEREDRIVAEQRASTEAECRAQAERSLRSLEARMTAQRCTRQRRMETTRASSQLRSKSDLYRALVKLAHPDAVGGASSRERHDFIASINVVNEVKLSDKYGKEVPEPLRALFHALTWAWSDECDEEEQN
jgi:hypothetical protein